MSKESARNRVTRRDALRWLATGVAASVAGCGTPDSDATQTSPGTNGPATGAPTTGDAATASPANDLDRSAFSTVVDFGELDASDGTRSIVPILEEKVTDDSLVRLPPGRYLMTGPWNVSDVDNVAVVGDDATIVVPPGFSDNLFSPGPGNTSGFRLEGLTFDFTHRNTGGRVLHAKVDDGLVVRDISVRGTLDVVDNIMRVDVTDPDGSALVERLHLPDGAVAGTGASGVLVGGSNRGDIRFADCRIQGFPDNALYASPDEGTIEVFGGVYMNSGISNVRIRGDSHVRGVHVRCDRAPEGFPNMRGIRLRGGSNVLVEDCTVEMLDVTYSDGAITVSSQTEGATIRNTHVRTDADRVTGLRAKPLVRKSNPDAVLDVENVTFTGTARDGAAVQVTERDSVTIHNVCIQESGESRNGIGLLDASDVRIADSYVDVPGVPIHAVDSAYITSNVETSNSGDLPGYCQG